MALIKEDFIRCTECDNAEFRKEERFVIPKVLKARKDKTLSLPIEELHIIYKCARCGHELDR